MRNNKAWTVLNIFIMLLVLQSTALPATASDNSAMAAHNCHQMNDSDDAMHCQKTTMQMQHGTDNDCCKTDCHCPSLCLSSIHSSLFLQAVVHFNPIKLSFSQTLPAAVISNNFYRPPIA